MLEVKSEVTAEEMIRRAEALVPSIRARASETEALRRIPDATIADVADAGLFSMLAPRRYGGHQLGLDAFVGVTRTLASACPSTAWTISFLIEHNWMISRFSQQAQEDAFAENPYVLLASAGNGAPTNRMTPAPGGYRLSGSWGFASAVMHSDWAIVSGNPGTMLTHCLIPVADARIDDVWQMAGMRGTGSNTIVVDDIFVPEHRVIEREMYLSSQAPGVQLHPDFELLGYEFTSLTNLGLAPIAVGAAEACLALFAENMPKRKVRQHWIGNQVSQLDSPIRVAKYGQARGRLHIAQVLLEDALRRTIAAYREVDFLDEEQRTLLRVDMANAAHLAGEVIQFVCRESGGGAYHESSPYQRYRRDIDVLLGHHINDLSFVEEAAGRSLLGIARADKKF